MDGATVDGSPVVGLEVGDSLMAETTDEEVDIAEPVPDAASVEADVGTRETRRAPLSGDACVDCVVDELETP